MTYIQVLGHVSNQKHVAILMDLHVLPTDEYEFPKEYVVIFL